MSDEKKGKVLKFKSNNSFPSTMEIIENVKEEIREFPVKKAFVILLDEHNEPTFWGSQLTKQEYAKCYLDFQMHVLDVLYHDHDHDYFGD